MNIFFILQQNEHIWIAEEAIFFFKKCKRFLMTIFFFPNNKLLNVYTNWHRKTLNLFDTELQICGSLPAQRKQKRNVISTHIRISPFLPPPKKKIKTQPLTPPFPRSHFYISYIPTRHFISPVSISPTLLHTVSDYLAFPTEVYIYIDRGCRRVKWNGETTKKKIIIYRLKS